MAIELGANPSIEGAEICGSMKLLGQYSDDLWIVIKFSQVSFSEILSVLEHYRKCTGLVINYEKTEIMSFGSLNDTNAKLYL